jgi:hypothetical protein
MATEQMTLLPTELTAEVLILMPKAYYSRHYSKPNAASGMASKEYMGILFAPDGEDMV